MAVDQPLAGLPRGPDDVVALPRPDVDGVRLVFRAVVQRNSVHGHDLERAAVDVHRMHEVVVGADEADLDGLADLHRDGVGRGIRLAVDGEVVRQRAFHQHGGVCPPLPLQPFLKLDRVVDVGAGLRRRVLRRDQQGPVETERLLTVRMVVAVVEVGPALGDVEFVGVGTARRDRILRDLRRSVHFVRHDQPVPMHRRAFRQSVVEIDPDVLALGELKPRSRHLAVVRVGLDRDVRQDVPPDDRSLDVENLDAVLDAGLKDLIALRVRRSRVCHLPGLHR